MSAVQICSPRLWVAVIGGLTVSVIFSVSASAQVVDDAERHGMGLIFSSPDELKDVPQSPKFRAFIPERMDLSRYFPRPGDQGLQGSCTGWAVGYAARAYLAATFERRMLAPENIPSPAYIYNKIGTGICSSGSSIVAALRLLKDKGSLSLRDLPYNEKICSSPTPLEVWRATDFRIDEYSILPRKYENGISVQDLDAIRGEIANRTPVIIGMKISGNSFDGRNFGRNFRPGACDWGPDGCGHAMVVVGYDDAWQALKVINSWGTKWGEGGFGWISYKDAKTQIHDAFTMRLVGNAPSCSISFDRNPIVEGESTSMLISSENAYEIEFNDSKVGSSGSFRVAPAQTTRYLAKAKSRYGHQEATCSAELVVKPQVRPFIKPVISSFIASPATITEGGSSRLSWSANGAEYASIDQNVGVVNGRAVDVTPTEATTYTLTVANSAGTATASTTVAVLPHAPTCSLEVRPRSIERGATAVLEYRSEWAFEGAIDNGVGAIRTNGTVTVSPSETTRYKATFAGRGGNATCTVALSVIEPKPVLVKPSVGLFAANPKSITRGERVQLSWSVTNADVVTLNHGIGEVNGNSIAVTPESTTEYTLVASSRAGSSSAQATVTVAPQRRIVLPDGACGKIDVSTRGGKTIVTGFVGKDDDYERIRALAGNAAFDLKVRPWPQCEALMTLDKSLARPDRPSVKIRRSSGDILTAGDYLIFDIETPAFPGYVHAAYIQADGSVLNLVQPGVGSFTAYRPRSRIVIGDDPGGKRFRVAAPFGREMLIVLVGKSPIFPVERKREETEREFLTALRFALLAKAEPSAPDRDVVAAYDAIVTKDKGAP